MPIGTPLVAICGPTGSGKSGLAVHLARTFDGEVINSDSLQVYRHFDVGTAKLSVDHRGGIPHHLIDVAEPDESFTAGDFASAGRESLQKITQRGHLPIIAGGTGFYLRALLEGLSPAPPSDLITRQRLSVREGRRPGSLHRLLRRLDSVSAGRIHAHDIPKLIRALEIRILTASNPSALAARDALRGYRVLKLALFPPRDQLYRALDERSARILAGGLLEEIQRMLDRGIPRSAKPFQSLGYKEGLAILDGTLTPDRALTRMQRDTRRYAKRQMTWFRREPDVVPLPGFGFDPPIEAAAINLVGRLINSD